MSALPLTGLTVSAGDWPAARLAGGLLAALGAQRRAGEPGGAPGAQRRSAGTEVALGLGERTVTAASTSAAQDWEATELAFVTGRPGGPPLTPRGRPATLARALGLAIEVLGGPSVDGARALGARVGRLALRRGGTRSAGGAARLLRCGDGWVAVSLPRESDRALVPALIEREVGGEAWDAVSNWARGERSGDVVARAALLGLAVGGLGERPGRAVPWTLTPAGHPSRVGDGASGPWRVVNLGALWAAPLAAQLLHRAGAEVVDVSAIGRPDPAPAVLRALLHAGHRTQPIDLATDAGRAQLRALLAGADVVIEASRPRALRQLGLDAETVMADGRRRTWLRITGHGPGSERAAFGDDAAVAGGLVAHDAHGPVFAGDAIADPLSGLTAALLALACARSPGAWIADVPMAAVAASAVLAS